MRRAHDPISQAVHFADVVVRHGCIIECAVDICQSGNPWRLVVGSLKVWSILWPNPGGISVVVPTACILNEPYPRSGSFHLTTYIEVLFRSSRVHYSLATSFATHRQTKSIVVWGGVGRGVAQLYLIEASPLKSPPRPPKREETCKGYNLEYFEKKKECCVRTSYLYLSHYT